jgi:hypothetical protein
MISLSWGFDPNQQVGKKVEFHQSFTVFFFNLMASLRKKKWNVFFKILFLFSDQCISSPMDLLVSINITAHNLIYSSETESKLMWNSELSTNQVIMQYHFNKCFNFWLLTKDQPAQPYAIQPQKNLSQSVQ